MNFIKEKTRSLGFGMAAGLAASALICVLAWFGAAPFAAVAPSFVVLAIVLAAAHYWKTLQAQATDGSFNQLWNRLSLLENEITETQGLVQLSGLNEPFPIPFGGAWALTPDAAAVLAREVVIKRPGTIVELGSGVSTLIVGRLLRQIGAGKLISLDHDPSWAEETRRNIIASGLQDYVEVLDAPLAKQRFDDKEFFWYQIPDKLKQLEQIDMLTVDGPPQSSDSSVLARYPALPAFAAQLTNHAVIFVDDAKRNPEQKMLRKWLQEYPGWSEKMIDTIPGTCILERSASRKTHFPV